MRKRNKRFVFSILITLGILLITLLLGYVVTQSSWFLNVVRKTLISQVNKQINGTLDIASLEGNIFKNLTIHDISLTDENSELNNSQIVHLKKLDLNYDLRTLLQKKVSVTSIYLSDLDINLYQDNKGIWNVVNIPKTNEKETTEKDTTASSWQIELASLTLSNSQVFFSGPNLPDNFPEVISISELISQASLASELKWELSKLDLAVQPQNIKLSLVNLQGNDNLDINLEKLNISSNKSQIQLTGNLINQPIRRANLSFQATPLDFSEIQEWLPTFPLQGNPKLTGQLEVHSDSLSSEMLVSLDKQLITLQAHLPNLQNPFTSNLDLNWKEININKWKEDLPASRLNGHLTASLQGESWQEADTKLSIELEDSEYNSYAIYTFLVNAKGSTSHLESNIEARSEFGEIATQAILDNLLSEIGYDISGSLKNLDIKKIIPTSPYQAEINSIFSFKGLGINPEELETDFLVDFTGSSFANKSLNSLNLRGKYQQGNYLLQAMSFNYDGIDFSANGQGNIYKNNSFSYNLKLDYLPQLLQEFQPELDLKGSLTGTAKGTMDNILASTLINLQDIKFQDYQLASFTGESEVRFKDQKPEVDFTGHLTKIALPTLPVDSLWINANYTPEKAFIDLDLVQSDTLGLRLRGDIFLEQKLANFTKLEINALGQKWKNKTDSLQVSFNPEHLSVRNLELYSNTQVIETELSLKNQESYKLKVKFDSLALWPLRYLNPQLETIAGTLSLDISGEGDMNNPQLSVNWDLANLSLREISFNEISGNIDYQDNLANLDVEVNRAKEEFITLKGYLPFLADISNKEFTLLKDRQLNLDLKMTPLDLSILNDYIGNSKEVSGVLNVSAKLENTINSPKLNAKLLLEDVAFKYPALGIDYKNFKLDFEALNNKLTLKELSLPSGKKGYVKANGSTVLNLANNQLDSLRFSLNAKDWQVLKNSDMDLKIDSKLELAGNSNFPTFSGNLNVQRAYLYLPILLGKDKNKASLTTPLLLVNSTPSNESETVETATTKSSSQIIKNLRGKMKISFPHNTWITSKEMNLELGGELEIIKSSPDFALSGNIMVVRGSYTVYGRKFSIESGDIYFQGESDMNPEISIVANYILRNSAQEKVTLAIEVTGRLQEPVLRFLLDDQQISEGDGVSYILFGKSTAELSSGEKSQISGSGDSNLATQIVMNQITSRVSSAIQNKLNLDLIEFNGDDNWRQAQVVVGKYLTNNLFLSYEREFSFGSDNEITPEKFTLEYELTRQLFLQGTQGGDNATGLDLIWKYQK